MNKIPTVFLRDETDRRHVTAEPNPDCAWVFAGEGVPTRKYDGTCVMYDGERWWARREVKPGGTPPPNFTPVTVDGTTGKTMGWEPIEQSAFAKFHAEALDIDGYAGRAIRTPGTYELVGPKVNGNPENSPHHILVEHDTAEKLTDIPLTFDGLRERLALFPYEGIVFHHPDGRMAKIKRRDFRSGA